jgi:hypothetical protein
MTAATVQTIERALLYGRKSSPDKKNPGKSVGDQLDVARAEAIRRGLDVVGEFAEDDGTSASRFSRKSRPQ